MFHLTFFDVFLVKYHMILVNHTNSYEDERQIIE